MADEGYKHPCQSRASTRGLDDNSTFRAAPTLGFAGYANRGGTPERYLTPRSAVVANTPTRCHTPVPVWGSPCPFKEEAVTVLEMGMEPNRADRDHAGRGSTR